MDPTWRFYETVKESRGSYFVEYHPPIYKHRLAALGLVFTEDVESEAAAKCMESELEIWLTRYPLAVMVSAYDGTGLLLHLKNVRKCDYLIGYIGQANEGIHSEWRLLRDEEIPADALDPERLRRVYAALPFKTPADTNKDAERYLKRRRFHLYAAILWVAVIPAAFAIVEFLGPLWLSIAVLVYGLWKSAIHVLKLTGVRKPSSREIARREEELLMKHHHYHCKENPEGFLRVKLENFERMSRKEIAEEAALLKAKSEPNGSVG